MRTTRLRILSLILALGLFVLAGCSAGPTSTTAGTTTAKPAAAIKIGGIGPLTGGAAVYGSSVANGAKIAIEEVNALGGLQFELKFEDDEHDAEKSVNAYNSLKDWGMQILCGTVTTTPGIAVTAESFKDRIFTLTPSASSTSVIEGKDNVFQMCFTDPNQGIASAQYIAENKLGSKIAIIYNNADAYSTGIYEKFISEAAGKNLDVVSTTTFTDDTANDFNVQLTAAKNGGADLIFLPIYYQPASLILTQADAMGYEPKFFGVDGMDGILTMENFNTELAEGVMLLTPFAADATDARTVAFVAKYQAAYNELPNQFAADGYDCIYAIYEACKKAGVTSDMDAAAICDKLIEAFTAADFSIDGLTGENMTWAATGEVAKAPKGMVIEDGVYVGMQSGN
ncbi:MAG: ABC transporter substrate-binding protein [Clostridiaceae bacterium]|jgi:branched-chain amino acid transport system substrate-binding protein|nr:ABC transporter substrate-binding protein [Clostridiales bacterium]MDD2441393.1 ABC transporter substrate-binding protein [Eubacteriales bacterium]MDD4138852.1 ABC transporter substrate-binding protein [Eubacteriales bacterium]MDD4743815.1 ABC transporter substrate-binding protein [Eubacteriales bacterium]NLB44393.1 ABC transporter substrate-binding protein [Clostridiaceae bacterium]